MGSIDWEKAEEEIDKFLQINNLKHRATFIGLIRKMIEANHEDCDVSECCSEYASTQRESMYDAWN